MKGRWRYLAAAGMAAAAVAVVAIVASRDEAMLAPSPVTQGGTLTGVSAMAHPDHVRWIAVGGGVEPASNQVSIEQDIALAGKVLGDGGVILFAGGPGRSPVQIEDGEPDERAGLHRRLGDLFQPRAGREARYRQTRLTPQGDAQAASVLAELAAAMEEKVDEPLYVLMAGHGEQGERPNENLIRLWGGMPISTTDLAVTLDDVGGKRPLRLLMASCFSGGFADVAFVGADEARGATDADRCGLFATSWDKEAAGCDPNPDRRAQESYFLHVLRALEGTDRNGQPLASLDRDRDGRISLLEAHTQARIASRTISIPTTTSERWLRHAAPADGPSKPYALVEDEAVIQVLGALLDATDKATAAEKLAALTQQVDQMDEQLEQLEHEEDMASAALRIALLERWPVLDDPYHAEYRATVDGNDDDIRDVLDRSDVAARYQAAMRATNRQNSALDELDVDIAMLTRLVRAFETQELAARLHAKGGPTFARYLRFLACERSIPQTPMSKRP